MKCPSCQAWTSVNETRGTQRRRECANGHRFSTLEVSAEEFEHLSKQRRYLQAKSRLRAMGYLK